MRPYLGWIREQATGAAAVFSPFAPALYMRRRWAAAGAPMATTHWASFHLLPFSGAIPVNERVVVDGNRVFAAGRHSRDRRRRLRLAGRTPRGSSGSDDPVAHGLRARTALQQRHNARDQHPRRSWRKPGQAVQRVTTQQREATARRIATRLWQSSVAGRIIPNHQSSEQETTISTAITPWYQRPNRRPSYWPCGRRSDAAQDLRVGI